MNGGWGQGNQQATAKSWLEMTKELGKWVGGAVSQHLHVALNHLKLQFQGTPADTRHACD